MPMNPTAPLDVAVVADLLSHTPATEREEFMLAAIVTFVQRRPDLGAGEMTIAVRSFVTDVYRRTGRNT